MTIKRIVLQLIASASFIFLMASAQAGVPMWTLTPLTATTINVPANGSAVIEYTVTLNTSRPHTLAISHQFPLPAGVTQINGIATSVPLPGNICEAAPPPNDGFTLTPQSRPSCTLVLLVNGSQLAANGASGRPIICDHGNTNQCYRPNAGNELNITRTAPVAVISVSGSPLTLFIGPVLQRALSASGIDGNELTVTNVSPDNVTATNIHSNFTGTALNGHVTETGNTCANVVAGASCTLTYTPGNTAVPLTNFPIAGDNTNTVTAQIKVQSSDCATAGTTGC